MHYIGILCIHLICTVKKFFTRKAATSWGSLMQPMKYCCKRMSVAETNQRNDNTTGLIALGVVVAVMAIVIIIMAIVIHRLRINGQKRTSAPSGLSLCLIENNFTCP